MDLGFWILDFGFWILDLGFWILDFGFWILDLGFWILDFGFWILDFGFGILDFGSWILDFGFWILDFGFWIVVVSILFVAAPNAAVWILDFGSWILDFGFWVLDFGSWILDFGFRILDFGFTERFGFCIRLFYYTPTRVGGFVAKISMKYAKIDTLENVFGGNHFVGWVVAFCSDLLRVFYKWKSVCRPGMTGPINFFWISLDRGATFLRMAGLRAGINQNVLRVLDSWGRTRIYRYTFIVLREVQFP